MCSLKIISLKYIKINGKMSTLLNESYVLSVFFPVNIYMYIIFFLNTISLSCSYNFMWEIN